MQGMHVAALASRWDDWSNYTILGMLVVILVLSLIWLAQGVQ
jgi:hypothetical protein